MKSITFLALCCIALMVLVGITEASIRDCAKYNNKVTPISCPSGTTKTGLQCLPNCAKRYDDCTCDSVEYDPDSVWYMYWPFNTACPLPGQVKINGKCMSSSCSWGGATRVDENWCTYTVKLTDCGQFGSQTPTQCPAGSQGWMGYCLSAICPTGTTRSTDFCLCY